MPGWCRAGDTWRRSGMDVFGYCLSLNFARNRIAVAGQSHHITSRMTTAEHLANLEREFTSDDGFFLGLHQRNFDPRAAVRAASLIKNLGLSGDHEFNYGLLSLLWSAQTEIQMAIANGVGGTQLVDLEADLFPEFARIFDAELNALNQSLRTSDAHRT